MKIVLVSPHFPPNHIGGVENYVKRLADDLRRNGDDPEVICVERTDQPGAVITSVLDADYGYPVHRIHLNAQGLDQPLSSTYQLTGLEPAVERLLEAAAPDVLHLHSGYLLGAAVLAAARRRRIPTVVTLHDFWFICPRITMVHPSGEPCTGPESATKCAWCIATEQRRYRIPDQLTGHGLSHVASRLGGRPAVKALAGQLLPVRALETRHQVLSDALRHADVILSPSRFLRDQIALAGIPADRIDVSRYGIEIRAVPHVERQPGTPLRIGYLGQLAPHKGVHILIEALQLLPAASASVRLFGDPRPHPAYVRGLQHAARTDGRITFQGPYQHSAVYGILADLDLIVVPSVWYENSPFVIQEAQSAHVPVIASRLGGMRELVTDEQDGLLFETGSAPDLARQLRRMLEDHMLLERLRPNDSSVRRADDEMRELRTHYQQLRDQHR